MRKSFFPYILAFAFTFLAIGFAQANESPTQLEEIEVEILISYVSPDGVLVSKYSEEPSTFISSIMPYSTDNDLYDRMDENLVIQLTDDTGTGQINQTKLDALRDDCSELINTYLRGRYEVPLDPGPKILTIIEADLLVYKLYTRRADYEIPDSVKDQQKNAMKTLNDINRGNIKLEDQPDVGEGQYVSNKKSTDRLFSDDTLKSF